MLSKKSRYPTVKERDFRAISRALWNSAGGRFNPDHRYHDRPGGFRGYDRFFDMGRASNLTKLYFEEETVGVLSERIDPSWPVEICNRFRHRLLLTPTRFVVVRLNDCGDVDRLIRTKDWMNSGILYLNYRGVIDQDGPLRVANHVFELRCDEFRFVFTVGRNWYSSVPRFLSGFLPLLTHSLSKMIYFPEKINYSLSHDSRNKLYEMCMFPEAGYSRKKFRILSPDFQNIRNCHKVNLMKKDSFLPVAMPVTQTYPNCVFYSTNIDKVVIDESISRVYDSVINQKRIGERKFERVVSSNPVPI